MIQKNEEGITENIQRSTYVESSGLEPFDAEGYTIQNIQGAGYVYDANGKQHFTGLFNISASHQYDGYCVDINTMLHVGIPYKEASDTETNSLFPVQNINMIRKILNVSYPFINDLRYLAYESGVQGLTAQEAVIATQAAIWRITNPQTFQMGTSGNSSNVINFFNYLMDQIGTGYDLSDIENIGYSINMSIDDENATQMMMGNYYLYGPFTLKSNSMFTNNVTFSLSGLDSRITLSDIQGNILTSLFSHDNYYFKVPLDARLDLSKINACIHVNYGVDIRVIISEEGISASQACIVILPLFKEICATHEFCLASLIITKIVEENCCETLEGVVFELYNKNDELIASGSTDEAGVIKFYGLLPGKYTLKEVSVPSGYQLLDEPIPVIVECPETRIFVDNSREYGRIRIVKYHNDPQAILAGAEFDLLDENFNIIDHLICDENGICTTRELKNGIYYLVETKAPSGFQLDKTPLEIVLNTTFETIQTVYIENQAELSKGIIEIIKMNSCCSDIMIVGAEFAVLDSQGELVDFLITNSEGKAVSQPLFYGNYTLVETKAPDGYRITEDPVSVNLDREFVVVELFNQMLPNMPSGRFRINKYDESCHYLKLEGAEFEIFTLSGNRVGTMTTKLNEYAYSERLPFGTYILLETKPPKDYAPNPTPIQVTINSSIYIQTLSLPNRRYSLDPKGFIKIVAFDENCPFMGVEGVEFTLYDKNNEITGILVTDQKGEAYSDLIPLGDYKIINTNTPSGYKQMGAPILASLTHEEYIPSYEILLSKA